MWHVIRIAYFENDKSALLLGPLKHVIEDILKPAKITAYLQSHWKFGPHIDLTLQCSQNQFDACYPRIKAQLDDWLKQHPSTTELQPEAYEKLSYQLGMSELASPPYLPLLTNNSVSIAAYELSESVDIEALHQNKVQFLQATCELTLALVALKQQQQNEFFVALILMMGMVAMRFQPDGIRRGYISYRSHAEFFLENYDQSGALRQKFDALDQRLQSVVDDSLAKLTREQWSQLSLSSTVMQLLRQWSAIVDETYAQQLATVTDNYQAFIDDDDEVSKSERHFVKMAEQVSSQVPSHIKTIDRDFNTGKVVKSALQHEQGKQLFRSKPFIAYRLTVNYFYLLLPTLEISPVQKFSLCHILANAVERQWQLNWQDIIPVAAGGEHG
ncbi:lantibiotic dehydratase C-terminal domain-containing protein [Idiomarina xiamenensis]|uniref:Thiopeptide-type bacteriocin biosynthesis domain-containing protein n=1 Tax=Idiomarina xiamenensis 10-D-4 TaxID=740709 RepID=K2LCF3_9GAMM|nr:lantibiotic dehydratase C-terminal domain-containing protein [Idiomarina xiamenensis]EKE87550.1 hypothetical protein A10D4_00610 [Idiomarina xiamenensis 10-D-4]